LITGLYLGRDREGRFKPPDRSAYRDIFKFLGINYGSPLMNRILSRNSEQRLERLSAITELDKRILASTVHYIPQQRNFTRNNQHFSRYIINAAPAHLSGFQRDY